MQKKIGVVGEVWTLFFVNIFLNYPQKIPKICIRDYSLEHYMPPKVSWLAEIQTWWLGGFYLYNLASLASICNKSQSMRFSCIWHLSGNLVPKPSQKVERGSEQHSSSYEAWSMHKECHKCIWDLGFKFSDSLVCCTVWLEDCYFLCVWQPGTSCEDYFQFSLKYDCLYYACIITLFTIWLD